MGGVGGMAGGWVANPVEFLYCDGGWWGLHNHFHVEPNYSVEVVLGCANRN